MADYRYVLITPARNEEAFIERTIQSVISQTVVPVKWVIVSDGSTDRTDEIVAAYAKGHGFIDLLHVPGDNDRNFGSKVRAVHRAYGLMEGVDYDFIGILDADITFEPDYYGSLFMKFALDGRLGIAGGFIHEKEDGMFVSRPFNNTSAVPNAIQLFRRGCYEDVGGFIPLRYGGEDWYAEVMARARGWRVESFPDIKVLHHRRTLAAEGQLKGGYRQGKMDYDLGSSAVFEFFKCAARVVRRPFILYAACRFAGFVSGCITRKEKGVPNEFVRHLRGEQHGRLLAGIVGRNTAAASRWNKR